MPGYRRRRFTGASRFGGSPTGPGDGARSRDSATSISTPAAPSGGRFGDSKASKPLALALIARQPRRIFEPNTRHTSLTSSRAATRTAVRRFWRPSLRSTPSGICEPVTTTGRFSPRSRKASAEAV